MGIYVYRQYYTAWYDFWNFYPWHSDEICILHAGPLLGSFIWHVTAENFKMAAQPMCIKRALLCVAFLTIFDFCGLVTGLIYGNLPVYSVKGTFYDASHAVVSCPIA